MPFSLVTGVAVVLVPEDATLTTPADGLRGCMVTFKNQQLRLEVLSQ